MQQVRPETRADAERLETSWTQLGLEGLVACGVAVLLFLAATRIRSAEPDATVLLGLCLALHATALIRLFVRAARHADRDTGE